MSKHLTSDHVITGGPRERAMAVIARHLCGWIMGHSGPVDRFLVDAELIVNDVEDCGINVAPSREQVMVALHSICVAPVDYAIGMACTSASNHDQQADAVLALIQGGPWTAE